MYDTENLSVSFDVKCDSAKVTKASATELVKPINCCALEGGFVRMVLAERVLAGGGLSGEIFVLKFLWGFSGGFGGGGVVCPGEFLTGDFVRGVLSGGFLFGGFVKGALS